MSGDLAQSYLAPSEANPLVQNSVTRQILERVSGSPLATVASCTSTATYIGDHGLTKVTAVTTQTFLLSDPLTAGRRTTILMGTSTSTATTVTPVSATFLSTNGATNGPITFSATGSYIELQSLSTSLWAVVSRATSGCTVV